MAACWGFAAMRSTRRTWLHTALRPSTSSSLTCTRSRPQLRRCVYQSPTWLPDSIDENLLLLRLPQSQAPRDFRAAGGLQPNIPPGFGPHLPASTPILTAPHRHPPSLSPPPLSSPQGSDFDTCIENIDIGGPSMLRSAAKNNAAVAVLSSPSQYGELLAELDAHSGCTSLALRRKLASAVYATTSAYDSAISRWFAGQLGADAPLYTRTYEKQIGLKYGCNPHQVSRKSRAQAPVTIPPVCPHAMQYYSLSEPSNHHRASSPPLPSPLLPPLPSSQNPSFVGRLLDTPNMPFEVLNGTPGYINFLDAANAWQLAAELKAATGLAAAASFKHVSPAGAGVAVPLSATERAIYEAGDKELTPVALAYMRARNADPMCSFGDFVSGYKGQRQQWAGSGHEPEAGSRTDGLRAKGRLST